MLRRDLFAAALCSGGLAPLPSWAKTGIAPADGIWDVVVAGSGLAGLCAAASALESGARHVLVLEKGPLIGGHSAFSSGSLSIVSPRRQKPLGIEDSVDLLVEDSRRVGGKINEAIIRFIGEKSEEDADWLESLGVPFSSMVFEAAAGLRARSIGMVGGRAGRFYVRAVHRHALKLGMQLRLDTPLKSIAREDGLWRFETGASPSGTPLTGHAKALILATGGFTANVARRLLYDARLDATLHTTANPHGLVFDGAMGDGIDLGVSAGAACADMDKFLLLAYAGGKLLEYAGADIYLSMQGNRFVNEVASTGEIADALFGLPEKTMWVVTDSLSVKGAALGIKLANGSVRKSDSIAEMARGMGIAPQHLENVIRTYNESVDKGYDPQFGKTLFLQKIAKPPFYWGMEYLNVHNSLGGLVTDTEARVLTEAGTPVAGLYAAGETVGGIFGKDRLGGMALTAALVMGREAGQSAAAFAQTQSPAT